MPDVLHQFNINAAPQKIFDAFCTSKDLNNWWPDRSSGQPKLGEVYTLFFGPEYDWTAEVVHIVPGKEFTWKMTQAMDDWMGTTVGVILSAEKSGTKVSFFHRGWKDANEHYRISNFCWAILLWGLKNYVEKGEVVPFDQRQ